MAGLKKDIKRIANNALGFGIGGILARAVGFLLIPVYTRFLTPADYGVLEIANVMIAIFSILFLIGQIGSLQRFYFDYNKEREKLREYVGTIVIFVLLVALFITVILSFFGRPVLSLIEGFPFNPYVLLVLWIGFFSVLFPFPQRLLQVREKAYIYSLLDLSKFLITVGAIIFFVVIRKQGALGSLKGQLIAAIIAFAVACVLIRKDMRFTIKTDKLRESLRFGLPLVPHALAGWILTFADRAMINHYIDLTQVGIYSLGYKFGMVMSIIVTSVNLAWAPFFMSTMTERGEEGRRTISRLATYYIAGMLFIAMGISLFAKEIIRLMATGGFYDSHRIIPIIVASYVFQGLYFIAVNQIFYIKKTKLLPFATFGAAIINILLNIWWIPAHGIIGAAWATLVSFAFMFFFTWILANRVYSIRYEYSRIIRIIGVACVCCAIPLFVSIDGAFGNILLKFGAFLLFPIGLYLIGFLKRDEIAALKNIAKDRARWRSGDR